MSVEVDIKQLLEAGAHFGHKTSRWHPKMAPYIHSKRGGSHIIDLVKTVEGLETALEFITKTVASGRQVLFVGTKRQAHDIVLELAQNTKMPYVTERWPGGMLTNTNTIGGRIKHLKDLESKMATGELNNKYNKLEIQRFQEEIDRMNVLYGGVKDMAAKPGAVFVFDIVHDRNAINEARKLNIPLIGLVDTNADPSLVTMPIPCNDDAIKTLKLVADYVQKAVDAGRAKVAKADIPDKSDKPDTNESLAAAEKATKAPEAAKADEAPEKPAEKAAEKPEKASAKTAKKAADKE